MPSQPPASRPAAVGIDVGGTKILGGVVDADGAVLDSEQVPTPGDGAGTLAAIETLVAKLLARNQGVVAVGVGAAGLVEWPGGRIRWAPHNAYRDLPLREVLAAATCLPVVVDNDANVAAWAESRFGAGHGADDMVLLTIGTGIGTGLVLAGHVYRGSAGIGAELGHMIVDVDGAPCPCGNVGCLEAMASGSTLGRLGREAAAADPGGRLAALAAAAATPVTGEIVFAAALEGDKAALGLFERVGHWLGVGIASLVTIFDPDLVVVGGGVAATGDLLLAPARASFQRYVHGRGHRDLPPVVPTRLGDDAGLVGAASLALGRG